MTLNIESLGRAVKPGTKDMVGRFISGWRTANLGPYMPRKWAAQGTSQTDRQARSTDMDQPDLWYKVIVHSDAIRGRVGNYMLDGTFVLK